MRAAWYERQGPAADVLVIGEMPNPEPGPGEVRIAVAASGINPGDVKKRRDEYGYGMPYPRVIPHSDGAGVVDRVGAGVPDVRIGQRVWCFGAQSYRPFGTAAEYCIVPATQAVPLPDGVSYEQGACLGIPGLTAHRAVHAAGPVDGRWVLVQGGAGAVGVCAVQLAARAGAKVMAVVRRPGDIVVARDAGAHQVLLADATLADGIRRLAPDGVHHIVEVAFGANIGIDSEVLVLGGSIATYATDRDAPPIPYWPLVFKNARLHFLGSDDFPASEKIDAARALNDALASGWSGLPIAERLPLTDIARAHALVEQGARGGRVVINPIYTGR